MEDYNYNFHMEENQALEQYLSHSIISYGQAKHPHETPIKLSCSCSDQTGTFIGAVMGTKTLNLFFISHIYVEEDKRDKGIGSKLLKIIELKAKEIGCSIIRLNTFNHLSHSFYLKNGYSKTICISNYMSGFDLVYYDKNII